MDTGPRERNRRIGVIGAGASGLTCAHALREAGYEHVTVLEREPRVGGKCRTVAVDGRTYEMGAVLGTAQYAAALGLMHPSGLRLGPSIGGNSYDPDGRPIELVRPGDYPHVLFELVFHYAWLTQVRFRRVNEPGHAGMHPDLFAPFAAFAEAHGFGDLLVPMGVPFTAFGYGSFDEVPAAYVMKYLDLTTLDALHRPGHSYVWPEGIETVWTRIAESLDVRTGWTVRQVTRSASGVQVETDRGAVAFDALVLTGPLDDALGYLDASPTEQELFSAIEHEDYWVLLCDISGLPDGSGSIPANFAPDRRGHLMLWNQRWPHDTLRTLYVRGDFTMSQEQIVAMCAEDLQRLGARLDRVLQVRRWKYFPHLSTAAMAGGWYETLEAMQGARHTYYAGEVMSFSCIAACVQYARHLVGRFLLQRDPVGLFAR